LEKEMTARARQSEPAGNYYKKRHRKELSTAEIVDIVHCYVIECASQADVARKHRISVQLVGRLVAEAKKKPEKLRDMKARQKQKQDASLAAEQLAAQMLERGESIRSCRQVQAQVEAQHPVGLSDKAVRQILKKEIGLRYRSARKVPTQANSQRCLVLRQ